MPPIIQFFILLVQVFPSALKAIQAWQDYHGKQLTNEHRVKLAADIKSAVNVAVTTKDATGLADTIKNLGKPLPKTDAPNPQNPA